MSACQCVCVGVTTSVTLLRLASESFEVIAARVKLPLLVNGSRTFDIFQCHMRTQCQWSRTRSMSLDLAASLIRFDFTSSRLSLGHTSMLPWKAACCSYVFLINKLANKFDPYSRSVCYYDALRPCVCVLRQCIVNTSLSVLVADSLPFSFLELCVGVCARAHDLVCGGGGGEVLFCGATPFMHVALSVTVPSNKDQPIVKQA